MLARHIGRYLAIFGFLVVLSGTVLAQHTAEHVIKIGSFLSLTGPASLLGEAERNTLEMYIDHVNSEGGVLGKELVWIHYDAADDAERAQTAVKRLIEQDKVDLIIGGSTSGTTLAVIPLIEKAGLPFISLAASVDIIDPVKPWVFKIPPTDLMAVTKLFEDMENQELRRIGLISGTDSFGASGRQYAKELAGGYGIEIVADEVYNNKDTDMMAQLARIRSAPGVQAVLNFGTGQGPATVTRQYRQLQLPWPLYQSHGVASPRFIELIGASAEGIRLPAGPLLAVDQLSDTHPQKAVLKSYRAGYQWRYGSPVSTFGGYAYDALMLAVSALERAGTTDKEAVRKALEETRNHIGVTGVFTLTPDDHLGLGPESMYIMEIRNGRFTLAE